MRVVPIQEHVRRLRASGLGDALAQPIHLWRLDAKCGDADGHDAGLSVENERRRLERQPVVAGGLRHPDEADHR